MNVYLAGPMQNIKDFNFPAFKRAALLLRRAGHSVFNPAEKDVEKHGKKIFKSKTGSLTELQSKDSQFSLRTALAADTQYICLEADAIALLPGWENSKGAQAEWALARALGHKIIYLTS